MKKACILLASPRKQGNTAALTAPFAAELERLGWSCRTVWLYDLELRPCRACRVCQQDWTVFGCPQEDDMQEIFDSVLACDLLVLATPIYSWYCTPPMKAVLDRLVYGMNKYYGREKGPSLWEGKPVALMNKDDKVRAIRFLNESGAFLVTKSGDKVAKYFGISKYTLYSYIDANKDGDK